MNKYFTILNHQPTITEKLLHHAETTLEWKVSFSNIISYVQDIIDLDPGLQKFKSQFGSECIIIKMNPNSFYKFHTDTQRKCAINMVLAGYDSACYFGNKTENSDVVISDLIEVPYAPNRCILFNTQHHHGILNRNNTRYLLSLGCFKHSYEEVYEWCIKENF